MTKTAWVLIIILIIALIAGGVFYWWSKRTGKVTPQAATTTTFPDVPTDFWAYDEIEAVAKAGYMIGYTDGTFKPLQGAKRYEVALAFSRATSKTANPTTPTFPDVPTTHQAYQAIEGLKEAGYMLGYRDGTFKPDQVATRGQVAAVLARAKGLPIVDVQTPTFADVPATHEFYKEIEAIYKAGYTTGCRQEGTTLYYCPDDENTRAQLAVFLSRAFITPTTGCTSDSQCSTGQTCQNGTCVTSGCTSDSQCSAGQTCQNGTCATATSTSTSSSSSTSSSTSSTTTPAKTGPEVPLAGIGLVSVLFGLRYYLGKK